MNSADIGVYVFSGPFDAVRLGRQLGKLALRAKEAAPVQRCVLLDCHDQSLRASGRVLIESGNGLRLVSSDGRTLTQPGRAKNTFVSDLADGPVKDSLSDFPKLRALMSVGDVKMTSDSFVVVDDLDKTHVRGEILSLTSEKGEATIVTAQSLRGYDRSFNVFSAAFAGLSSQLRGAEAVFKGLFPDETPYVAKPILPLSKKDPVLKVATEIIATYLSVARQNESGVIADIDTEFLHDYRVSLRKVRSVLSLFKGVLSEEQTARLKREFSDLMEPTGRVRDLDVYLLEKELYYNLVPENLHEGLGVMFAKFDAERKRAQASLSRRFKSTGYDARMSKLKSLFADARNLEPGPNAEQEAYVYACALIWKRYRKVCKIARGITARTPDERVHELRIDCKKLRYLMEFFSPLFNPKAMKKIIKSLKGLQDNLGLFNDYSVQQDSLHRFVDFQCDEGGRANAQLSMAVGGLIAVLSQRQQHERERVMASFERFDHSDTRKLFQSLFHPTED